VAYLRLRSRTLLFICKCKKVEGAKEQESLFFLWELTKGMKRETEEKRN